MVIQSEIPVPWEVETGISEVLGHLFFHTVLEASLGYMRLSQTNKIRKDPEILWHSPHPLLINLK